MNGEVLAENPLFSKGKGDILIVDDIPENLHVLFELLTAEKYEVRRVKSGKQALRSISADPPDLILLDIRMPDMDGYEVCRRLKAQSETEDIPVIFLSALDDALDKVKAFSIGGADYISKPFQTEEVLARIKHQLIIQQQKEELIHARQAAELSSKIKSEFLSNIRHEIRTPLTTIMSCSEILKMTTKFNEEQLDLVDTIFRRGDDLLAVLDDILEFSRLEAGDFPLRAETFPLAEIKNNILEIFEPQAQKKDINLVFDIHQDLPQWFSGSKLVLRQILKNLVENAIKFTQYGSVKIEVSPQFPQQPPSIFYLRFSVEDTGCGISPENQTKIFEPFTQADSSLSRQYGGLGLGLSICQKLAQQIGETIQIESEVGKGTIFWFSMPLELSQRPNPESLRLST